MEKYKQTSVVFKAFCDPTRVKIIDTLSKGEMCACVLCDKLDIAQSALSYHMKILCDSGIVTCTPIGKWIHYSISKAGVEASISLLRELTKL